MGGTSEERHGNVCRHLHEDGEDSEGEDGEHDGEDEGQVPVAGLQQQLQVDHQHHRLAHSCLQRPQVSLGAREPKHRAKWRVEPKLILN